MIDYLYKLLFSFNQMLLIKQIKKHPTPSHLALPSLTLPPPLLRSLPSRPPSVLSKNCPF